MTDPVGPPEEPAGRPNSWLPPSQPSRPRQPHRPRQPNQAAGGAGDARSVVPPPVGPRPRTPRLGCLLAAGLSTGLLVVAILLLVTAVLRPSSTDRGRRSPPPATASSRPSETPPSVLWSIDVKRLRTDQPTASISSFVDGSVDELSVVEAGGRWMVITGRVEDPATSVLHGIDPATGRELWRRELDGVMCAGDPTKSGVLCASIRHRDPRTQAGDRWRLHLIDPATGVDRRSRDLDSWLSAVHVAGSELVLLEQPELARKVRVRAFGAEDLAARWTRDLSGQSGVAEMFDRNYTETRPRKDRPGPELDRPRFRDVGAGLVTVGAGDRTAFIDRDDGKLIMFPHCSRLVDDGDRLWCNEVDGATSYSYAGNRLARVRGPRLAFPSHDNLGTDVTRPVFIDAKGAGISVNAKTGRVGKAFTPPGVKRAFGLNLVASAYTLGEDTFMIGPAGTMLLERHRDRIVWRQAEIEHSSLPIRVANEVLLGSQPSYLVDPRTGRITDRIATRGFRMLGIGSRIAVLDLDELSVVRIK